LRDADAILVAGHDSEVILDAGAHVGDLEAGLLQILGAFVPGLPVHLTFFHNIVENLTATIVLWRKPGQLSGRLGDISCVQTTNGSRSVCQTHNTYSMGGLSFTAVKVFTVVIQL